MGFKEGGMPNGSPDASDSGSKFKQWLLSQSSMNPHTTQAGPGGADAATGPGGSTHGLRDLISNQLSSMGRSLNPFLSQNPGSENAGSYSPTGPGGANSSIGPGGSMHRQMGINPGQQSPLNRGRLFGTGRQS